MKAMLLAAGLGQRLRPVTANVAKPAVDFLGLPLAFYILYYLEQLKLDTLVVNTHYKAESIYNLFSYRPARTAHNNTEPYRLIFSNEEPHILGSGGGVYQARRHLFPLPLKNNQKHDQPIVVCNADSVIVFQHGQGFEPLIEAHKKTKAWMTFLTTNIQQAAQQEPAASQASALWTRRSCNPNLGSALMGIAPYQAQPYKPIVPVVADSSWRPEHFTGVYIMSPQVLPFLKARSHIFVDLVIPSLKLQQTTSPKTRSTSSLRWPDEALQTYYDPHLKWFNTNTPTQLQQSARTCAARHAKVFRRIQRYFTA